MAHHHAHHPDLDLSTAPGASRAMRVAVGAVALVVAVGAIVYWPSADRPPPPAAMSLDVDASDATVTSTDVGPCSDLASELCELIDVRLTSGPDAGHTGTMELRVVNATSPDIDEGDRIRVLFDPSLPENIQITYYDHQRRTPLLLLAGLFVAAVVALGRWQGLRALGALALTLVILVAFVLPALLDGGPPLGIALVAAGAIALVALYLTHGVNEATTVALLGTFSALALTGILGVVFVGLASFSGFASEEARTLYIFSSEVDIAGLLLAGLIIGSLGVLDDVTVTQVSAVAELHRANTALGFADLYRSALRIGRDHIASTVNTLVLAYAGAALPLLLLYTQSGKAMADVLVSEVVAVEVVRTLVGSIGLVASVPITTALATWAVRRGAPPAPGSEDPPAPARPAAAPSWDDFAPEPP